MATTARTPDAGTSARTTPPQWATPLLTGAALVLLLDMLRVLLPSIAFVYGNLGSTPAGEMAVIAVVVFGGAALASRAAGINATISIPLTAGAVGVARLALAATSGGRPQMLVASVGFVAAVAFLGALAASDIPARAASRGLALGFVAQATISAILFSQDSLWYGGAISWLLAVVTVFAVGVGLNEVRPTRARPDLRTTTPWLLLGPLVAVHGIFALSPGGLRVGLAEDVAFTGAGLVLAHAVGLVLGRIVVGSFLRESMGIVVLAGAAFTAIAVLGTTPGPVAIATIDVAVMVPLALVIAGEASDDVLASRGRRGGAPGLGMLLYLIVALGYYVSYEVSLGLPRGVFPAGAIILVGVVLRLTEPRPDADPPMSLEDVAGLAFAPFLALVVLAAATTSVPPPRAAAGFDEVRVMTYNVRMGFDVDGRFRAEDLANVIRRERPDIVVLNEVDRGWALTGGHDVLAIMAQQLRMHAVFGPAADPIWGNAVLSRFPMTEVEVAPLPTEDTAMERSALSVTVDLGAGETLGVIATHLSHRDDESDIRDEQVAIIAEMAAEQLLQEIPVAILGDLNATPGADELEGLANFVDAVALAAPDGADLGTFPSGAPTEQIDHVLISRGFSATDLSIPATTLSDHRGVAVTLRLAPPGSDTVEIVTDED